MTGMGSLSLASATGGGVAAVILLITYGITLTLWKLNRGRIKA